MLLRHCMRRPKSLSPHLRIAQMASQFTNGPTNGHTSQQASTTLVDLPKSNNFTSKLPPDPAFPTPKDSDHAPRGKLGPRMVRDALYTFVRPVPVDEPELLGVSPRAMEDIGLKQGEEETEEFKDLVAGNKIFWTEEGGIYPWAQCYGGWQFGSWAGQLGDGRAISLFESTNPKTKVRYEIQLKGAGKTPYSRFADGKAVLRSSIREYVVSEALNALGIPTTRALSLTLAAKNMVAREKMEPGAIVARFAQSWLRIGTFDILRARGDRKLVRQVASYVATDVFPGWGSLPSALPSNDTPESHIDPPRSIPADSIQGPPGAEENRFTRLYREIARRNAKSVAAWQAYGFMNGVLNTDNTSIYGLSLDYGPFAFMDNFDPAYTPNHDDHMLRYSYRNQPSIIWWNLVRLGESLGELIGAGDQVDTDVFISEGVSEEFAPELIKRAETIIDRTGEEYKAVFMTEYKRLMTARLGLKTQREEDFSSLFSELLDTLEKLELDFNHFFRRLASARVGELGTEQKRKDRARVFFHKEGITGLGETDGSAAEKVAKWLEVWRQRVVEDWGESPDSDKEREAAMKAVNPNFVPRGWVLDEVIERVQNQGDREVLGRVMQMALEPFREEWGGDLGEEERFCGDVPREGRGLMCSCSS
jgi:serine/tyrosine/threonine adenylyltransferase